MKLDISDGSFVRLRNGEIVGPVYRSGDTWISDNSRWLINGRYLETGALDSMDIVGVMTERDARHIKIAMRNVDMSFTPSQFDEWLSDVRKAAPGITNKEIAQGIGRSDQWISNASSTGVNHHSALALWYYLNELQRNCNE